MSYVKHTWVTGETVTAENLNHVESGIENSQEKIDASNKLSADHLSEGSTNKLVSAAEKATWSGKSNVSGTNDGTNWSTITIDGTTKAVPAPAGVGKTWKSVTLSALDVLTLASGGEITGTLSPEYDPTNFKNDYFLCNVEQTGVNYGTMIYPVESMTSIRVSLDSFINVATYLGKSLLEGMSNYGFFHNYYRTMVLFAGTSNQETGVIEGPNIIDGNNMVYVQDVSQQYWEYNIDDTEGGKGVQQSREQSDQEVFGTAYVFHFKGASSEMNFLYCMQDSQAAYWDSTANKTKWANIKAGCFYQVAFDTSHDTLRWLVTPTTVEGEIWATEISTVQKTAWQTTGINFGSNIYAAHSYNDTILKAQNKIIGYFESWLDRIVSINEPFGQSVTKHLEYIGRPIGYMLDTITYNKGGVLTIEKDGEHVWECIVDGVTIKLIIPDNIYADTEGGTPVPHRDTYIMRFDMSNMASRATLYRHTFTVRPWQEASFTEGDTIARICFCAVNAQAGDSSIDYLLHSDETGQGTDWILPVSGIVGIATGTGQAVTKWYTALRVMAGWKEIEGNEYVRCLYINYLDEQAAGTTEDPFVKKIELLADTDADLYEVADFRTDLLMVNTPYSGGKY